DRRRRKLSFGIRLHVIVRETNEEAWAAADDLIKHVTDDTIASAQKIFSRMDSVGQQRMAQLHGGRRDKLEISPNLWAGVGLVRVRSLRSLRADGLIPWIVPLAIVLIWQVACVTGFVSERVLPAPTDVVRAGWKLLLSGELERNLWVSFWRAGTGFLIGGGI